MTDSKSSASANKAKAFKPRAGVVRKNKAERDAYAKEEAEKAAARAAAAAQAAPKPIQNTKASASKKRETAKDNRDGSQILGSGVFGAGSNTRSSWKRSNAEGGHSEMLEGQEGIRPSEGPSLQGQDGGNESQRGGGGGTSSGVRANRPALRDGVNFESDNEPDETPRDIEKICISSDDENLDRDEADTVKGKARAQSAARRSKQGGLRPVRARRASSEEEEEEIDGRGREKVIKSNQKTVDGGNIQDEEVDEDMDDSMAVDGAHVKQDMPSSPEVSKRTKSGRRPSTRTKDGKIVIETVEEKAERLRLDKDIEKLRNEFVVSPTWKREAEADGIEGQTQRTGKLLLFQFPPLIPFLTDHAYMGVEGGSEKQQPVEKGPSIKADPDGPTQDASVSGDNATNQKATFPKTQIEGMLTANEPVRLPPGRVGKLNVHKSGKVTLDWGGADMEIRFGTQVDFLQDAVLVQTPVPADENEDQRTGARSGTTYALGQVQNKMIVIPDWQRLYD